MNSHIYRQYDDRWRWLPYPSGGYYLNGSGCGCVAVTHCIIEMEKYKKWTPANVQPYMKQFAIRGNGTKWAGILTSLKHYGLKNVANIPTMPQLWRTLEKGNYVGVLLFGNTKGPDGTVWTTGGHYIAFTGYRVKNGQHQLYLKDSGGRKHDGWYSYEKSMKGDVRQVWVGQIPSGTEAKTTTTTTTTTKTTTTTTTKLTVDGIGGVSTIKALQKYLKVSASDGKLSGQNKSLSKYYPGITSVSYGTGGSATVKALQKWVGASADGVWGQDTSKKLQKKLGVSQDGIFGKDSVKALQKFLNNNLGGDGDKKTTTTTTTPKTTTTTTSTSTTTTTSTTNTAAAQTSTASTTTSFKENVIDISYVQSKTIDWNKVKKAGIHGAIIRCGYRGYGSGALNEDSMFMTHIANANKVGLKLGIYFFTEAINAAEGKEEAQFALKMLKKAGVKLTYPIAIDTENIKEKNPVPRANSTVLSKAKRTEAVKAFCEEIKANGYEPMIYASTDWLNNQLDMSKLPYTVWVAQYNTKVTYTGKYALWQYTSTANVDGFSQDVDKSYCYVDYKPVASVEEIVEKATIALKSIEEIAQEVLDGKWKSGATRKTLLTEAGYNYDEVQKKVNELVAASAQKVEPVVIEPEPIVEPVVEPEPEPEPVVEPVVEPESEPVVEPIVESTKSTYQGEFPATTIVKTNAEVINDTVRWGVWIAGDNRFHYGYTNSDKTINAHHNGCYFCGTNTTSGGRSKKGVLDYQYTYCCNPFVGAAFAHGGCVPKALELCRKGTSWDYHKGAGYDASSLFTKLGHPAKTSLKKGDVLCRDTHVALYAGDGKIVEAGAGDDNVRNSTKWNNSIRVQELTDANYANFPRVYRFNSSVNATITMAHGEISNRVLLWQKYLNWYLGSKVLTEDGIYGDNTLKYTKQFQEIEIGPGEGDGLVGPKTIAAAKKVEK